MQSLNLLAEVDLPQEARQPQSSKGRSSSILYPLKSPISEKVVRNTIPAAVLCRGEI